MEHKPSFTKKDLFFTIACLIFLLMNIGAIGTGGRNKAKTIVCSANLRQWGAVFQIYANDYDGSLPPGLLLPLGGSSPPWGQWIDALRDYYKDPQLCFCPSATKTQYMEDGTNGPGWGLGEFEAWGIYHKNFSGITWPNSLDPFYPNAGSYGTNSRATNPPPQIPGKKFGHGQDRAWKTFAVAGGDEIPLLFDCANYDVSMSVTQSPPDIKGWHSLSHRLPDKIAFACIDRHQEQINMLFLDGTVRKVGLKELWILNWNRGYRAELIANGLPSEFDNPFHWIYHYKNYIPSWLSE